MPSHRSRFKDNKVISVANENALEEPQRQDAIEPLGT
jgi:hypothetical protein